MRFLFATKKIAYFYLGIAGFVGKKLKIIWFDKVQSFVWKYQKVNTKVNKGGARSFFFSSHAVYKGYK